jgi:hypothetical protein
LRAAVRGSGVNLLQSPARLYVDGIALWSQRLPGWERARDILAGRTPAPETPAPRPAPELLAPTERRRAPDTVAIAIESAMRACASAERDPASLPCVFSSMHGDLAITDYMCATISSTPTLVSPTKFHNSVHNAAAGYWSIGTGCMRPYTALSAGEQSFGAGLLETCVQALSERQPVLLVAYDIDARGPLAPVANSRHLLSVALVLTPEESGRARARIDLMLTTRPGVVSRARPENAALVAGNSTESCLPLMEALALGGAHDIVCLATPTLGLAMRVQS